MVSIKEILLRVIALALLIAACAVSAVFAGGLVGWLPPMLLAALLFLCVLYLVFVPRFLDFEALGMQQECQRGEEAGVQVALVNRSVLPVFKGEARIYITDSFGEVDSILATPFMMAPRGSLKLQSMARFAHIGTYETGVESFRIYDPVGLFWRSVPVHCNCEVTVQPRIHPIESIEVDVQAATESNAALLPVPNEGMDYSGVREYVFGDPMKLVHWKLSARSDENYTRLFEVYTNPGVAVLLDLRFPDYPRDVVADLYDALIETAFSIAACAQRQGLDMQLRFADKDGQPVVVSELAADNMPQVVRRLPRPHPAAADDVFLEDFEAQVESRYGMGNMVLCSAQLTRQLCELAVQAKERGKSPVLYAAVPLAKDERDRDEYLRPLRALDAASIGYQVLSGTHDLGGLL